MERQVSTQVGRGAHDGRRLPMAPRRSARLCGFPAINDRSEGDPFPS
jgi:hypothetical protein